MSRIWGAEHMGDIASIGIGAMLGTAEGGFRSLYSAPPGAQTATMRAAPMMDVDDEGDAVERARIEGFTHGFDEGCRVTRESDTAENDAAHRLAEALELLAPAPSGTLSSMLSAAVIRLVEQIVGEVEIDAGLLQSRCDAVASMVEEGEKQGALHLHPDDLSLVDHADLGVRVVADAQMKRGCVRLDTADGWIEDGPDVRLARLYAMLADMEGRP
ncbi:FliH/SctL family protein [Sphingobium aromaticiconvertens]|uniref:FliH/SctL family protein n=1 Tax=Sphingobium aromaticiconvertens TaxID=365341 RepID=UPI003AFB29DF